MTPLPSDLHLRLAGVTRLSIAQGRGPKDAFIFDPHRLALPCWALALEGRGPALLVTLDRHFDLVPPAAREAIPGASASVRELDEYARWNLDVRNYDHVLAAMDAGLISDAVVVARARPRGSFEGDQWRDRTGQTHQLVSAPTVERLSSDPARAEALASILARAERIILDIDLDCFTSPSDADPWTPVPWPRDLIQDFLMPPGSEQLWSAVLSRCVCLTLAREPHHCGGLLAAGRLFEDAAIVLFGSLFQAELP